MGTTGRRGVGGQADLIGRGLESAWERAWAARARAAQCGDYAAATRWHRRALALGAQLTARGRRPEVKRPPGVNAG
jgi:hypothetical protein